jgi:hypothetical protein
MLNEFTYIMHPNYFYLNKTHTFWTNDITATHLKTQTFKTFAFYITDPTCLLLHVFLNILSFYIKKHEVLNVSHLCWSELLF